MEDAFFLLESLNPLPIRKKDSAYWGNYLCPIKRSFLIAQGAANAVIHQCHINKEPPAGSLLFAVEIAGANLQTIILCWKLHYSDFSFVLLSNLLELLYHLQTSEVTNSDQFEHEYELNNLVKNMRSIIIAFFSRGRMHRIGNDWKGNWDSEGNQETFCDPQIEINHWSIKILCVIFHEHAEFLSQQMAQKSEIIPYPWLASFAFMMNFPVNVSDWSSFDALAVKWVAACMKRALKSINILDVFAFIYPLELNWETGETDTVDFVQELPSLQSSYEVNESHANNLVNLFLTQEKQIQISCENFKALLPYKLHPEIAEKIRVYALPRDAYLSLRSSDGQFIILQNNKQEIEEWNLGRRIYPEQENAKRIFIMDQKCVCIWVIKIKKTTKRDS